MCYKTRETIFGALMIANDSSGVRIEVRLPILRDISVTSEVGATGAISGIWYAFSLSNFVD